MSKYKICTNIFYNMGSRAKKKGKLYSKYGKRKILDFFSQKHKKGYIVAVRELKTSGTLVLETKRKQGKRGRF